MLLAAANNLYVGLITGGAALLGAIVGGVVSGVFALKGEEKRQTFARDEAARREQQEHDRETTVARGAARLMASEFKRARAILLAARQARRPWPEVTLSLS